ncbi:predicted protein, partial [Nematostella vectensis]
MIPVVGTFAKRSVQRVQNIVYAKAGRRKGNAVIAFTLISVAYLGYIFFIKDYPYIDITPVNKNDVTTYCNYPLDQTGNEGKLPQNGDSKFSLEMVQLMIRHGDRSTAKEIPGMEKRDMDCSANPKHGPAKKIFEGYRKVVERFV